VRCGADHLGRFRFDQSLQHQLHALAHDVEITTRSKRVEQVQQVRLVQGHRRVLLRVPGKVTPSITPVAHPTVDPRPPPTYTTSLGGRGSATRRTSAAGTVAPADRTTGRRGRWRGASSGQASSAMRTVGTPHAIVARSGSISSTMSAASNAKTGT